MGGWHFRDGERVAEHHVLEDLFGMYRPETAPGMVHARGRRSVESWHGDEHVAPLLAFFEAQLSAAPR